MSKSNDDLPPLVHEVRRVTISEGDIVLIRCEDILTNTAVERIQAKVKAIFNSVGHNPPVFVLDRGLALEIISAKKFKDTDLVDLVDPTHHL
jgi:hypothetical protein